MSSVNPNDRPAVQLHDVLAEKVMDVYGADATVENLLKLSGGASRETWSFDAKKESGETVLLILKRDPVSYNPDGTLVKTVSEKDRVGRKMEGRLIELAGQAGVPAPEVPFYIDEDERTSEGFIMHRLEGETLGPRILRDDAYAQARPRLAYQCGQAAARIHNISLDTLPKMQTLDAGQILHMYRDQLASVDHPYPGFEYGFRWLDERLELAGNRHTLVHGDFRNGNIIVDAQGLRAVLDWELAYLGNPMCDLGWMCVPSWRFGHRSKPVGGFGEIADLIAGYKNAGGGEVTEEAIHYWMVFGTLRWGVMCVTMGFTHITGAHRSLEWAAVGRRTAETEYDLLQLVD